MGTAFAMPPVAAVLLAGAATLLAGLGTPAALVELPARQIAARLSAAVRGQPADGPSEIGVALSPRGGLWDAARDVQETVSGLQSDVEQQRRQAFTENRQP
jgi:nucleoid-associated protein YgaU